MAAAARQMEYSPTGRPVIIQGPHANDRHALQDGGGTEAPCSAGAVGWGVAFLISMGIWALILWGAYWMVK